MLDSNSILSEKLIPKLDTTLLINTFTQLSNLSFQQALEWINLIEAEERKILSSLKDNVDLNQNADALALAIASRAFATYAKTVAFNLPNNIKTGDISLQNNIDQLHKSATQMEKRYLSLINHLINYGISPFKEAEIYI